MDNCDVMAGRNCDRVARRCVKIHIQSDLNRQRERKDRCREFLRRRGTE